MTTAGATVLLVDDEELVRGVLARGLRHAGYAVLEAVDAAEAIAALDRGAVDLVVSDFMMPGTDGLSLLRLIRDRGDAVPFLLMSGYVEHPSFGGADAKPNAFIGKPFTPAQLAATVSTLCR